ncbi:uncharacterized protein LOC143117291 [Alosa pseudoharengus]|uniref:uncharacterized protein LOC143117291 n=1 Tax=Alosa pseudoharengus TaxID=34774 RepID=UPI003F89DA36
MLENHPDWRPSLLLGHDDVQMTDEARFQRSLKRKVVAEDLYAEPLQVQPKNLDAELLHPEELDAEPPQVQPEDMDAEPLQELPEDLDAEQPVMTSAECEFCTSRQALIVSLLEENRQLKEELEGYRMDERFLRGDDEKVKYYTGLPNFAIFQAMLLNILPYIHQGKRKLTAFQCVLLTLMRLRLDLPFQHLSHLFQVHRTTVGVAFQQTIEVLYARLSPIVHWPSRDCLMVSMPHQFIESFGKHVAAIVDCFEIFIEKPSNLHARAQTFSQYKHHHTMKYLIVITPQGFISFVSKGWGGQTSDKHLTENCGFLDKLLPGDIVLADRGFNIRESVGMMCAEVKIPAFTRGRAQLDAKDVEETRAIAHLRIHVERVIGLVRNKYRVLHTVVPIHMILPCEGEDVTFLDKIVIICCALTNMCESVII